MPFPQEKAEQPQENQQRRRKGPAGCLKVNTCPWHSLHRKAAKSFLCHAAFSGRLLTSLSW